MRKTEAPPPFNNQDFVLVKSIVIEVPLSSENNPVARRIRIDIIAPWKYVLPIDCVELLRQDDALLLGKLGAELVIKHAPEDFVPERPWWIASFSEHPETEIYGITDPFSRGTPKKTKRHRDQLNISGVDFFFRFHDAE